MRAAAILLCAAVLMPAGALAETSVRVRVGDHAAHGRVVFDWPARTSYQVEEAEGRIVLRFSTPAAFNLAAVRRPPRNVQAIGQEDGRVTLEIAPGARPRVFRLGTRIVVDVIDAPATAATPAAPRRAAPPAAIPASAASPAPASAPPSVRPTATPARPRHPPRRRRRARWRSVPRRRIC